MSEEILTYMDGRSECRTLVTPGQYIKYAIRFCFCVSFCSTVLVSSYGQERHQTFFGTGDPRDYAKIYLSPRDILQDNHFDILPPLCTIRSSGPPRQIGGYLYRSVTVPSVLCFGDPLVGFMKEADLKKTNLKVQTDFDSGKPPRKDPDLEKAIEDNQEIDPMFQQPEPYFARAEEYLKQGDYGRAMVDYFDGLRRVQTREPKGFQYVPYEKYFDNIKDSISKTLYQPVSVVSLGRGEMDTAGHHFSSGYTAFWNFNYEKALKEFDASIDIVWNCPIYWYYRGLTYWKLGDKEKAAFNLIMGSVMEKNSVERQREHAEKNAVERKGSGRAFWDDKYQLQSEVSEYLRRFQGHDRLFLEQIRWGDPSNLILKELLIKP